MEKGLLIALIIINGICFILNALIVGNVILGGAEFINVIALILQPAAIVMVAILLKDLKR